MSVVAVIRQTLDVIALAASCLALYYIVRMRATYFLDSRFFMGIANVAFVVVLGQSLVSDFSGTPLSLVLYTIMIFVTALAVGFASFLLMSTKGKRSGLGELPRFLVKPPARFLLFAAVALGWMVSGITLQPWKGYQVQTFDGTAFFYSYESWYLLSSLGFLLAFLLIPVATSYLQSTRISDPAASKSIRVISLSWASFGVVAFIQEVAAGSIAPIEQSVATLSNSLLFILIAIAVKEPTILSRIMNEGNSALEVGRPPTWAKGRIGAATSASQGAKTADLATQQGLFSTLLRMRHEDIKGMRLLLEFDPSASYERIVEKFAREFASNLEPVAVFTSIGSPVHRLLRGRRDVKLFSFSTKTSTPSRQSETEILLPERDASLLLDAVDKLLQAHNGREVGLAFDVFTDLVLFKGFEKAYGVMSSVAEMAESQSATILVLVNSTALEGRALSGVRGLFTSHLSYDAEGLRVVRTHRGISARAGGTTGASIEDENSMASGVKG